jgi:hypothetical protein
MGYSTIFEGTFTLDRPLSPEHKGILEQLAQEEHLPGEDVTVKIFNREYEDRVHRTGVTA